MPPRCLLLDLDGTMVDTDRLHLEAYNLLLNDQSRAIGEEYYQTHVMGFSNEQIMRELFPDRSAAERQALADRKEQLFRSLLRGDLEPTAGLRDLIRWAQQTECRCAVVTNAPRANAELMLKALRLGDCFDAVVLGEELPRGKPDPLPYRTALRLLGCTAEDALAFEDSRSGVLSASGAGAFTIGVLSGLPEAALRAAGARYVIEDFADAGLWQVLRDGGTPQTARPVKEGDSARLWR
jgi:HAD superfamily hydrolase (TIGR01509 family)